MADASKLKRLRRSSLGLPPPVEEARADLSSEPGSTERDAGQLVSAGPAVAGRTALARGRIDGRTLRRSGRTVQFATRVSPEFDDRLRQIAQRDRMLLVEVLERALDAYEQSRR